MGKPVKDKETERFYKLIYFIVPLPMVAGLIFAAYVLLTEDARNLSFCAVAKSEALYQQAPLRDIDFVSLEAISLDLCKNKDDLFDDGDGIRSGRVQWFVCNGTTCGPGWEKFLSRK